MSSAHWSEDYEGTEPPPEWATFFATASAYERFERAVRQHFLSRGERVLIQEGSVAGPSLGEMTLGLTNLAQLCALSDEGEWPALVARHMEAMSQLRNRPEYRDDGIDFATCREQLSIRIYAPEDVSRIADVAVMREDVPGLMSVLCLDLPTAVQTLRRDQVEKWGKREDELFELARANLSSLIDAEPDLIEIDDTTSLWFAGGDSVYNSSILLLLDRYPQLRGRHGMFLSAPTRHLVITLPFESMDAMNSVGHLMHLTANFEHEGPGSLSKQVWWHKDGRWIDIPWELSDEGIAVRPPQEFTEVLERIAADSE